MSEGGPKEWAVHFDGLAAQAERAGDVAAQADALQRAATALAMADEKAAAAERLGRAAELFDSLDQTRGVADSLYARGRLLHRIDGAHAQARPVFERAIAAYAALGEPLHPRSVECYQELAGSFATDRQWAQADSVLQRLGALLATEDRGADLAELLRARATHAQMQGELGSAVVLLDQAIAAAQGAGAHAVALQLRLQRWAVARVVGRASESIEALRSDAEQAGDPGAQIAVDIEAAAQALRDAQPRDALVHANQARFAALKSDDPIRYLLACTLIAEAHEALDDKPAVIEALLTCRATLIKRLGDPAGQAVLPLLDALGERWGQAELARARAAYRERVSKRASAGGSASS